MMNIKYHNKFKKDLSKSMPTVKLSAGNKEKDKVVVKIPTEVPEKKNQRKNKKSDAEVTLYINALCIFGGIEIK